MFKINNTRKSKILCRYDNKMKILELGPGYNKFYKEAVTIDINPLCKPDILHDLNKFPWPLKDNEFDIIYSSHCLEHLVDIDRAIEEIYRIAKHNALVIIKVPHFSSRIAYIDTTHKHYFSIHSFRNYTPLFSHLGNRNVIFNIEKIRLVYQPPLILELLPKWCKLFSPIINFINDFVSSLANFNIEFCERVWCYYVGGFGEVQFYLRVVKKC